MSEHLIQVKELKKYYNKGTIKALDGITVDIDKGDVMVVIGGRISANTTRLAEISRGLCPATHHIEGADELLPEWFEGAEVIGITAGASTPASQIEAVRDAIQEMLGA